MQNLYSESSSNQNAKASRTKNTCGIWALSLSVIAFFMLFTHLTYGFLVFFVAIILAVIAGIRGIVDRLKFATVLLAVLFCAFGFLGYAFSPINNESSRVAIENETPLPTVTPVPIVIIGESILPDEIYNCFLSACRDVGISYEDVSDCSVTKGDPIILEFSYNDCLFSASISAENTVTLESGGVVFMKNNQLIETVDNRIVTLTEKIEVQYAVKQFIKDNLLSPVSANFAGSIIDSFDGWSFLKNGDTYVVTSYVDSLNVFGVSIRNSFTVTVVRQEDGQFMLSMKGFNK